MILRVFKLKKYILTVKTFKIGLDMSPFSLADVTEESFYPLNLRLFLPRGRPDDLSNSLSAAKLCEIRKWSQPCQETCQSLLVMEEGELKKHSISIKEALLMS